MPSLAFSEAVPSAAPAGGICLRRHTSGAACDQRGDARRRVSPMKSYFNLHYLAL